MALKTARTSFGFSRSLVNVLARMHPVELENSVYFRVAVVARAMYAARGAGHDIYDMPVSMLVHLFFIFHNNEELVKI
jgi:hypothetical protein